MIAHAFNPSHVLRLDARVQAAVDSTIMKMEALKRTVTADQTAVQQLQRQMATQRRKLASSR